MYATATEPMQMLLKYPSNESSLLLACWIIKPESDDRNNCLINLADKYQSYEIKYPMVCCSLNVKPNDAVMVKAAYHKVTEHEAIPHPWSQ